MKYCINGRQEPEYLRKANEVKFEYRDIKALPDYVEKYPEVEAWVVEVGPAQEWNFDLVKETFILSKNKVILCIPDINDPKVRLLQEAKIPYYWGYEITTAYELAAMVYTNVCRVKIGAPLFFDQEAIAKFGIPAMVTANIAHNGYLPYADGVNGAWIRPEDVDMYTAIEVIDFSDCDKKKEQALFRIYAEQKAWPGKISMLISNINKDCTNRMLPSTFTEARLNCQQRCVTGNCRLCYRYFELANPELLKSYILASEKDN